MLAQPAAPPAKHAPPSHPEGEAIQDAPGEGDAEEAEAVDEAADAKPHSGPYASPWRIKDANGHAIPCGVHLRPFRKGSWYHASFDHAHRWVK